MSDYEINQDARDAAQMSGEPHMVVKRHGKLQVINADNFEAGEIFFVAYPPRWEYRPNRYRLQGVEE